MQVTVAPKGVKVIKARTGKQLIDLAKRLVVIALDKRDAGHLAGRRPIIHICTYIYIYVHIDI